METLFNLVWLALALAGLWGFLRTKPASRGAQLGLLALFCAVLLLFPAISISDDLHQEAFIAEDSSSVKRMSAAQSATPVLGSAFLLLSVTALFSDLRRKNWSVRFSETRRSAPFPITASINDRAPPAFCL